MIGLPFSRKGSVIIEIEVKRVRRQDVDVGICRKSAARGPTRLRVGTYQPFAGRSFSDLLSRQLRDCLRWGQSRQTCRGDTQNNERPFERRPFRSGKKFKHGRVVTSNFKTGWRCQAPRKNHWAARRMEGRVITGNAVKVTFSSLSWPSLFSWMQRLPTLDTIRMGSGACLTTNGFWHLSA